MGIGGVHQERPSMNDLSIAEIGPRIHNLRGQQVMLDHNLAELYEIETKELKRSVRRNVSRFPNDFMFEPSNVEVELLRCQIGTSKNRVEDFRGGNRYAPFVFTEPGIAMLSSVLNSEKAIQVNIFIIRAFIQLRQTAKIFQDQNHRLEQVEAKVDKILTSLELNPRRSLLQREKGSFSALRPVCEKIEFIKTSVTKYYGLKLDDLLDETRVKPLSLARQISMFLVRKSTGMSYREIGRYFGKRDHSTVLHACRKTEVLIRCDAEIQHLVESTLKILCT